MDITHLLLKGGDSGTDEYKSGWCDAVCYLNDNFIITKRNGEPITISFDVELDEEMILNTIKKGQEQCKRTTKRKPMQGILEAVKKIFQELKLKRH